MRLAQQNVFHVCSTVKCSLPAHPFRARVCDSLHCTANLMPDEKTHNGYSIIFGNMLQHQVRLATMETTLKFAPPRVTLKAREQAAGKLTHYQPNLEYVNKTYSTVEQLKTRTVPEKNSFHGPPKTAHLAAMFSRNKARARQAGADRTHAQRIAKMQKAMALDDRTVHPLVTPIAIVLPPSSPTGGRFHSNASPFMFNTSGEGGASATLGLGSTATGHQSARPSARGVGGSIGTVDAKGHATTPRRPPLESARPAASPPLSSRPGTARPSTARPGTTASNHHDASTYSGRFHGQAAEAAREMIRELGAKNALRAHMIKRPQSAMAGAGANATATLSARGGTSLGMHGAGAGAEHGTAFDTREYERLMQEARAMRAAEMAPHAASGAKAVTPVRPMTAKAAVGGGAAASVRARLGGVANGTAPLTPGRGRVAQSTTAASATANANAPLNSFAFQGKIARPSSAAFAPAYKAGLQAKLSPRTHEKSGESATSPRRRAGAGPSSPVPVTVGGAGAVTAALKEATTPVTPELMAAVRALSASIEQYVGRTAAAASSSSSAVGNPYVELKKRVVDVIVDHRIYKSAHIVLLFQVCRRYAELDQAIVAQVVRELEEELAIVAAASTGTGAATTTASTTAAVNADAAPPAATSSA
jgi:hypothetical protein